MLETQYTAIIHANETTPGLDAEHFKAKVGGKSILSHSIDRFDAAEACSAIILLLGPQLHEWVAGDPLTFASPKLVLRETEAGLLPAVAGVLKEAATEFVAIHSAQAPNFPPDLPERLMKTVIPERGAVPGLVSFEPAAYITLIGDDEAGNGSSTGNVFGTAAAAEHRIGHIMEHATGGELCRIQYPQCYGKTELIAALRQCADELEELGDPSEVFISGGYEVAVVAGPPGNIWLDGDQALNLLKKLLGTSSRKKKDKYGGLGW
jgi:2-C-methyl-D-erythritol 4-phosphate cytidylyltransferase